MCYSIPCGKIIVITITWDHIAGITNVVCNTSELLSSNTSITRLSMRNKLIKSTQKTLFLFVDILPVVVAMLLLTSLVLELVPDQLSTGLFGKNNLLDAILGSTFGGVAAGHPLVSYMVGGELSSSGVSLFAVTALIVSWVSVGVVQLPAEALLLGKNFAIYRNLLCYLFSIAIALLTVYTVQILG